MTAWTAYTNANLIFDKKKKRELANIQPSLHFYCVIILVKKKGLCTGMAGLPFQKPTGSLFSQLTFKNVRTDMAHPIVSSVQWDPNTGHSNSGQLFVR